MPNTMHFGVVFMNGPTHHVIGEWALPRYMAGYDFARPEIWQEIARVCERGKFDVVFFADTQGASDNYGGNMDAAIRYSVQFPVHDPLMTVAFMAAATERVGLAATYSTTYGHPYHTARAFGTLANLSRGRIGWNVVASSYRAEAANYGIDAVMSHDERYERAEEYVEVCQQLWASWQPGAIVADRESRVWADPSKIRPINHAGKYFKSQGPLNVAPAPSGPPVVFAAGQSDRGLDFCAKYGEAVFGIQFTTDAMKRQRDRLRERVEAAGRDPDSVPILWGVFPIVGETEEAARAKEHMIEEIVPPEGGLALISSHFGIDASKFALDDPLEFVATETGSRGLLDTLARNYGRTVTVGEAGRIYGCGISPHIVGTGAQVADQLEAMFDEVGGDGFLLMTHYLPGSLTEFVELVVPELQRRGRFRKDYSGATLRDHLAER
jgi:FMN-dependent oxidoreductase (nitrilotriacetate monooxygenase family)